MYLFQGFDMRYYKAGMDGRGERANALARKGKEEKKDTAALSRTHPLRFSYLLDSAEAYLQTASSSYPKRREHRRGQRKGPVSSASPLVSRAAPFFRTPSNAWRHGPSGSGPRGVRGGTGASGDSLPAETGAPRM